MTLTHPSHSKVLPSKVKQVHGGHSVLGRLGVGVLYKTIPSEMGHAQHDYKSLALDKLVSFFLIEPIPVI